MAEEFSGAQWVSRFPTSVSTTDLVEPFRSHVVAFLLALKNAEAKVTIAATFRPPERAYLMHYAWLIAKEQIDPAAVPSHAGVPILWGHEKTDGSMDQAASVAAAKEMVEGYGIVYIPVLNSNHTKGLAIDMDISWSGALNIVTANGTPLAITSTPKSGNNENVQQIGASYHVLKLVSDPPHWSFDGH